MGLEVRELTKSSSLTGRGGVRQVAVDTRRRPQDAAEGTLAHEVRSRDAQSTQQNSRDNTAPTLNKTA
jgi:hypothetical protein